MQDDNHKTMLQRAIVAAPAKRSADSVLVVMAGDELGRKHSLAPGETGIGRTGNNTLCVDHASVSRNHATLIRDDNGVRLRDNGSTNGTYVNEQRIGEVQLKEGDLIKVGPAVFKFLADDTIESSYHDEIYRLSTLDGLTQLYNKRYFHEALEREMAAARRYARALALLMFDIDHFKRCNDEYGHLAGDYVLRRLSDLVRERVRAEDIAARTGGEEFSIILPEQSLTTAAGFADSLRALVADSEFQFEGRDIPVTISVGVAVLDLPGGSPESFIQQADARLYAAKRGGRNRVVASGP